MASGALQPCQMAVMRRCPGASCNCTRTIARRCRHQRCHHPIQRLGARELVQPLPRPAAAAGAALPHPPPHPAAALTASPLERPPARAAGRLRLPLLLCIHSVHSKPDPGSQPRRGWDGDSCSGCAAGACWSTCWLILAPGRLLRSWRVTWLCRKQCVRSGPGWGGWGSFQRGELPCSSRHFDHACAGTSRRLQPA